MTQEKRQEIIEYFQMDRFATQATGIVIDELEDDYVKCSVKLDDRHRNAIGHVMGGVIYTLADFVFAVASNSRTPMTVTVVSQISYLSAPKGSVLYGASRMIKDGRRNCFYEVDITDDLGTQVARVSISGAHLNG